VVHAPPPIYFLQQPNPNPPNAIKHGNRGENVVITRGPRSDEPRRRVSTRDWQNRADLELKNDKTETPQIVPPVTRTTDSTPSDSSLESFPANKQRNPKKTKKQTTLHSPKRLGGLKPPLEQVQGDSKLHKP
jgi:hypothetical protein